MSDILYWINAGVSELQRVLVKKLKIIQAHSEEINIRIFMLLRFRQFKLLSCS